MHGSEYAVDDFTPIARLTGEFQVIAEAENSKYKTIDALMQGLAGTLASFMAYGAEKRFSKTPEKMGTGLVEGFATPEAANNAAAGGSMVLLLALGISGSATTAVMLVAFWMYGLQPGPLLFENSSNLVWALIASLYITNILLVVLNLPLVGLWAKLLSLPSKYIFSAVLVFSTIGAYSLKGSLGDVVIIYALGALAFTMRRMDFSVAPVLWGILLGPLIKQEFRRALSISGGDYSILVTRPLALFFLVIAAVSILTSILSHRKTIKRVADFRNYTYAKYGREILKQPGQFAWQIFDQRVTHLLRDEYRTKDVATVTALTLEALVEKLDDVDPAAALATLNAYNDAVDTETTFNPNIKDGRGTQGLALNKTNWANPLYRTTLRSLCDNLRNYVYIWRFMLDAEAIGYSASASGTFLSTKLFPKIGIWDEIKDKSKRILSERVRTVVARGEVEIGFQQVSELLPIEGIDYVGPIPDEVQKVTTFATDMTPALGQDWVVD